MQSKKVRYVLIDRLPAGLRTHDVGGNDEVIGALATGHLVEQGCRLVAHLRGPAIPTGIGRLRGYRSKLAEFGLSVSPDYIVNAHSTDTSGYDAMNALLRLTPRPDGVFCYNDPVAAGAIKAILEAGLTVPADIAVIGSGNIRYSDFLRVPLSTVDQGSFMIGETAAQTADDLHEIEGLEAARACFHSSPADSTGIEPSLLDCSGTVNLPIESASGFKGPDFRPIGGKKATGLLCVSHFG